MKRNITVVGLGYVGLPLAIEFGKKFKTFGFDINSKRVALLKSGKDMNGEVTPKDFKDAKHTIFTSNLEDIRESDIYIVAVPTPVDSHNNPDFTPLVKSSETVGKVLKKGDIVIYESTVYPGCTEEVCVPVLEKISGLKYNKDFFCGYSPERINPGDKEHTLTTIKKVTSGSTKEVAKIVDDLYNEIVKAGTFPAESIAVAEASKVIENSQRDINIAFVNELAIIFNRIGIDTTKVLEAAGSKWNFLKFKPGLVGGHCISVDPYYLVYKSESLGYSPKLIRDARVINNFMSEHIVNRVVNLMIRKDIKVKSANVLVLGVTFKENCPDIRNSKVVDIIAGIKDFGCNVDVVDPNADPEEVLHEYKLEINSKVPNKKYDAIVLAVSHDQFKELDLNKYKNKNAVVYDVKGILEHYDERL